MMMEDKASDLASGSPQSQVSSTENVERNSKEAGEYVLRWADHNNQLLNIFQQLWLENSFTDVTLNTDKKSFRAHKLVLSACSPYFRSLFINNPSKHQTVFVKDISSEHMSLLLDYMYRGCISVKQTQLSEILKSASTLHIRGLTTPDQYSPFCLPDTISRSMSPKPLIVDEMFGMSESPIIDHYHNLETSSNHSSTSARSISLVKKGGDARKSSIPKRLKFNSGDRDRESDSSSPGYPVSPHEEDGVIRVHHDRSDDGIAVTDDEEDQPMDFTKTKLDTSIDVKAARFSILGSYLKTGPKDEKMSGLTGSWLEPLAHLARSAPRPASRDSRGDSKDDRDASGEDNEEKDSKDYPQMQFSESLDIASKLRSHFLANLPPQSYAWLSGMTNVSTPSLPPSNYPGSWLGLPDRSSRHQRPSLLDAIKLEKHPQGGIRTGEIGANGKPTVKCEVCGKKLADPSSLYRHRKIHSGDKPHKCPYCERRFIQRYNMKQHIKTHRIEMLADQKTSFPMGKKGRHANISHSYGSSYHHEEQVALDMSN